jgi:hypothetical protein
VSKAAQRKNFEIMLNQVQQRDAACRSQQSGDTAVTLGGKKAFPSFG